VVRVDYSRAAERQLARLVRRIPPDDARAIVAAVDSLAEEPQPTAAIKLASQLDLYRLRVRGYRVVYVVDDPAQLVLVTRIARRAEGTYRGL
jgi:mRNA interferase RelE/StbE